MTLSVHDAIAERRATRKYTEQPVSEEVLDRIVRSALEAPSAFNAQMRDVVVVRDPEVKQALFDASMGQRQFLHAPVVFVLVARTDVLSDDADEIMGADRAATVQGIRSAMPAPALREAGIKDAMLAGAFLLLAAQAEGLGASPTTGWDEEGIKRAIGLEGAEDRAVALVVAAGYPDEKPTHPGRADNRRVDDTYRR